MSKKWILAAGVAVYALGAMSVSYAGQRYNRWTMQSWRRLSDGSRVKRRSR